MTVLERDVWNRILNTLSKTEKATFLAKKRLVAHPKNAQKHLVLLFTIYYDKL